MESLLQDADVRSLLTPLLTAGAVLRLAKTSRTLRHIFFLDDRSWLPPGVGLVDGRVTLQQADRRCHECLHPDAEWDVWFHEPAYAGATNAVNTVRPHSLKRLCKTCTQDCKGFRNLLNPAAVTRQCMANGRKLLTPTIYKRRRCIVLTTPSMFRNKYRLVWGRDMDRELRSMHCTSNVDRESVHEIKPR